MKVNETLNVGLKKVVSFIDIRVILFVYHCNKQWIDGSGTGGLCHVSKIWYVFYILV